MNKQIIAYGAALFLTISFARWGELFIIVGEKLLDFMPRWIARFLYPIENFNKDVQFYTRSHGSVFFSLADVPELSIYLNLVNHSPFAIDLDGFAIDVWAEPPHAGRLGSFQHIERTSINRHSTAKVFVRASLTDAQVRKLREAKDNQLTFSLHLTVMLDSKLGKAKNEKVHLEGLRAEISG